MALLFQPLTIGDVQLSNRIVMPPMVRVARAMDRSVVDTDGRITEAVLEHYGRRADAGTGMVIVEATAVDAGGRAWKQGLNAWDDAHAGGLSQLAARIKSAGSVASIQLVHGGPQGSSAVTGRQTVGPSAIAPSPGKAMPRELSVDEIQAIERGFADAAARVVDSGFDAVEIHGAHGFLLDSFLMKSRNDRTDAYGGSLSGRMRMLMETCHAVVERIGGPALVGVRISVHNKRDEGFSAADLRELVSALVGTGVDVLHVSTDGAFRGYFGTDRPIGLWVKELCDLPVIVAGGLRRPQDAERLLAEGIADLAAVGTAMLRDPAWSRHARDALASENGGHTFEPGGRDRRLNAPLGN